MPLPHFTTWRAPRGVLAPADLDAVVAALRAGRVVLLPTESSFAACADARVEAGVANVRMLKGRDLDAKPLLLLCASAEQAREVAELDERGRAMAAAWPAALTLVLRPRDPRLARRLGGAGLAVRVPDHAVPRQVCEALDFPITGTSANATGEDPALEVDEACRLAAAGGELVAGVVDAGRLPGGAPSTLVDLTAEPARILREGAFPANCVRALLAGAHVV